MLRGVDVGCSPCRISRRLHGVSHVFSAYRRVQNPCKTMAATSVLRGMRLFWITHMRFRTAFHGGQLWRGLLGVVAGQRSMRKATCRQNGGD